VDAQNAYELAKVALMQTLQLDPRGSYDFEAPVVDTTASAATFDLDSLLTRGLAQRVDLDAEEARVGAAEQNVRAASGTRWPTVSLTASYSSAVTSAADASLWSQLGQRQGGAVGIGISIPLFDRGAAALASQQASITADNARIALETQQREVALEVRRAYLDHQAAQEKLRAADAQLRAARQALDASQQRYRVGAATLIEVTQARATLVQAENALVGARYGLVFQRTQLAYYVGDLNARTVRFT
jgi:outer membrane protein